MFQRIVTRAPMYDPDAVVPMREELIAFGFNEMKSAEEVDQILSNSKGTVLVVINSVCGCAAGSARPGVGAALQHKTIPDQLVTSFAGQDRDAVDRIRQQYLGEFPPSSPSMALFKDGKVVYVLHRHMIEGRGPEQIAAILAQVFDQYCTKQGPSISPEDYAQVRHAVACGSSIPRFR
ncbi:MAG: BrxA/BrxB family bacilliredoxin [Acidobacteria bacterium]|nr:MAG: BrxA/BrxB family bacilliredoxin [Acidobacteriota bacterium]